MTTNELIDYVSNVMNLSGPDARSRIAQNLNLRYKQVTSSIGMAATRRLEASKAATTGSQFITFTGLEKLDAVYRKIGSTNKPKLLMLITPEEMLETNLQTGYPTAYNIESITSDTITLKINCIPAASTPFTLYGTALMDVSTLTNLDKPAFPESFHDILVQGAMADEYRRKEKGDLALDAEKKFESRLSDLRLFLAKNAYMTIYRGKHAKSEGWWDTDTSVEGMFGILP